LISIYDPDGIRYRYTSIGFENTSEEWSQEYTGQTWANGTYTYEVVAQSGANYARSDTVSGQITIDNTPTLTLNVFSLTEQTSVSHPEGKFEVEGSATFSNNPDGTDGSVSLYLDDEFIHRLNVSDITDTFKFSDYYGVPPLDAAEMEKDEYTFKAIARSNNGSQVIESVEVEIIKLATAFNLGTCQSRQKPSTCYPINFAIGNKYKSQTDIAIDGPGLPLAFTRHCNSRLEVEGPVGYGWTATFSDRITESAESIILRESNGRHVNFVDDGSGRYITETDWIRTIELQEDGYTLTERNGTQKSFDGNGRLSRIQDTNGNYQNIGRTDDRISSVSDNFGKILSFGYNADGRLSILTTPVGIFSYSYDALGNLTRVDNPDTTHRAYTYDDPNDSHNLTGITDENGVRSLTVTYDDQDRALTSALAGGVKQVAVNYGDDYQRGITDSLANETNFQLHVSKGIGRVESSEGSGCSNCLAALQESYELNERLLIDSKTDAENNRTEYTYDDRGRVLTMTEAVGTPHARNAGYSWHPVYDKITAITRPSVANPGQTTTTSFEYDAAGNLLLVSITGFDGTEPVGRAMSYTYNANGRILTVDGPREDVTDVIAFGYYPNTAAEGLNRGRLHTITNSLGQQTVYADYNAWGRPQHITDINGVVTVVEFDGAGRVAATTRNDKTTHYDYDSAGRLLSIAPPSGRVISYGYTDAGFVENIMDNAGNYIQYAYDSEGSRIREEIHGAGDELALYKDYGYDEYNRLANVFYPDGDFEDYYWDKNGNLTEVVDAAGKSITRDYDPLNRLEVLTQPGELKTLYDYDAHGNLIRVTDAENHPTSYTFNDLGDRVAEDSPDAGSSVYTYDAAGNLISKTDANQITVSYTYDALNRLTGIHYPDEAENVTYRYDEGEYGAGRLTAMIDASGSYEYRYDADGNLVSEMRIIAGRLYTTDYQYDPTGILTGITYPNGRQVDYSLDEAGRVSRVTTTLGGVTSVVAENLSYLPFGPLAGYDAGGATRVDTAYVMRYRLTGIAAATLLEREYTRDAVGNVTGIADRLDPDRSRTFGYDDLYRLTSAAGVYSTISYTYDDVGNRLTRTQNGQTDTYQYLAGTNRLEQINGLNPQSFTYDAAGNPTSRGTKSFVYNQNNRLIRVSENNTVTGDFSAVYIYLGSQRLAVVAATALEEFGVTVTTSEGRTLAGLNVYAFTAAGSYTGHKAVTDEAGRAVFDPTAFADGSYQFRADYLSDRFWSDTISLPDTVSADIVIDEAPVAVQVSQAGAATAGVKVYLFNESGKYLGLYATTDENGEVAFILPSDQGYKFRADVLGSRFMSKTFTVQPGASNGFQVATGGGRLTVTLQKQDTAPLGEVNMYLFNTDGRYLGLKAQSDPAGQVGKRKGSHLHY